MQTIPLARAGLDRSTLDYEAVESKVEFITESSLLEHYRAEIDRIKGAGNDDAAEELQFWIGDLEADLGNFSVAIESYEEALRGPLAIDPDRKAMLLMKLAGARAQVGDLRAALDEFSGIADTAISDPRVRFRFLGARALLAIEMGRMESAAGFVEALFAIDPPDESARIERELLLGRYHLAAGRDSEGLLVAERLAGHLEGSAWMEAFEIARLTLEYEASQSLGYYERALSAKASLPMGRSEWIAQVNHMFDQAPMEEWMKVARDWNMRAVEAGEALVAGDYEQAASLAAEGALYNLAWRIHARRAKELAEQGEIGAAVKKYEEAIETIETARSGSGNRADLEVRAAEDDMYRAAVDLAAGVDPMKALELAERARARNLLDAMAGSVESEELRELGFRRRAKERLRVRAGSLVPGEADSLATNLRNTVGDDEIAGSRKRFSDRLDAVTGGDVAKKNLVAIIPPRIERLVANVSTGNKRQVIVYFIGKEKVHAWVISKGRVNYRELDKSPDELMNEVIAFRSVWRPKDKILPPKEAEAHLASLYATLLGPLEDRLKSGAQVVVIPHHLLHYVPFQALRAGDGEYMIDNYPVSYSPSLATLAIQIKKSRRITSSDRVQFFGAMLPTKSYDVLTAIPDEEEAIREVVGARRFVSHSPEATEQIVTARAPDGNILHLACHGHLGQGRPFLDLSPEIVATALPPNRDGLLTVDEIANIDLGKTPLVVMGACNTYVGWDKKLKDPWRAHLRAGDDLAAISNAFLAAGASTVIASQWMVSDEYAPGFARDIYTDITNSTSLDNYRSAVFNLREAAAEHSENGSAIYLWAPYVMLGSG